MRAMADGRWRGSICYGLATEDEEHSSATTETARRRARGHPRTLREPVKHAGAYSPPALGEYVPSQDEANAARVISGAGARAHDATSTHSVCEDA
jgi:hypothetical protein